MDARRADLAFGVMLTISFAVTVVLALWSSALPFSLMSSVIMLSVWIGSLIFFIASFSLKFGLVELPIPVEKAHFIAGNWLRRMGRQVSTEDESLVVRVDSLCSVRLTFRPSPKGTLVCAQAWASPAGWSVTIIALLVWYFSALATVATAYIFLRSMHHSVNSLLPAIADIDGRALEPRELDIHSALLEGLSEARRLASEAFEGTRSNYQDAIILVAVGSIIVFMISLAAAVGGYVDLLDRHVDVGDAMAISSGLAIAFAIAVFWLVRARYRGILFRLKDWTDDLEIAFQMEVTGVAPADFQRSNVEVLADALKELPSWLSARRKSSTFREPGIWLVIVSLVSVSWTPLMIGVMALSDGAIEGMYSLLAGAGLIAGAAYLYLRWRRRRDAEDSRTKREWNERSRALDELLSRQFLRS